MNAKWIGIAGLIGAGKSKVSQIIRAKGYQVLNADEEAHKVYRDDHGVRLQLARTFGEEYLTRDGVDRRRLGALVFSDSSQLSILESIIHPALEVHLEELLQNVSQMSEQPVFVEGALFPRWPLLLSKLWAVWHVKASTSVRLQRVMERGLTKADAMLRMERQNEFPPLEHRQLVLLENEGSVQELEDQVFTLLHRL